MSFDLFLVAFRSGAEATADVVGARSVLERFQHRHRPEFNAYDVDFADGSHVEMYASGLDGGEPFDAAMLALRGFSNSIGDFVFEFSSAAGFVIFPAMEPACVLIPGGDLAAHLPADLGDDFQRIPVSSGAELLAALNGGYEAWRAYRDHALRAADAGPEA
jgi:hypothetical protein